MRYSPPLRDGHQIRLIEGGQAYFEALVSALEQARSQVLIETYIFDFHGAAAMVAKRHHNASHMGQFRALQALHNGAGVAATHALELSFVDHQNI